MQEQEVKQAQAQGSKHVGARPPPKCFIRGARWVVGKILADLFVSIQNGRQAKFTCPNTGSRTSITSSKVRVSFRSYGRSRKGKSQQIFPGSGDSALNSVWQVLWQRMIEINFGLSTFVAIQGDGCTYTEKVHNKIIVVKFKM